MKGLADLNGLTAVVTGAGSGIGLAISEAFVQVRNARAHVGPRRRGVLPPHAERLAKSGAAVRALTVDVTDPDAVDARS